MAEPFLLKTVVDVTSPLVKRYLDEAADKNKKQTERCVGYLRAAQLVIDGLHKEFEAIVAQAELCDLHDEVQVDQLRNRVYDYLHTNVLRPDLWTALDGMRECRTLLQQRVDSVLNLPWTIDEKQGVVAEFVGTIEELEGYLASLGYEYPSGVGLEMLDKLYGYVDSLHSRRTAVFKDARREPEPGALRAIVSAPDLVATLRERQRLTTRIERTINRLLATF
jgi:hypothetical protein